MNCFSIIMQSAKYCLRTALLLTLLHASLPVWAASPPPNWTINPLDFEFNMNAVIRLQFLGTTSNNPANMVGAFVGNELRGVATPILIGGEAYFYTTVYSNTYVGETVHFRAYYEPNDAVYGLAETTVFLHNKSIGSIGSPFMLDIDPNVDLPPVLSPLLADTSLQGIPFDPVILANYLFSADGDPVTWSAQPGPNLSASIVNGILAVTPISGVWLGTDSVRIIVKENTPNQLADTITGWFTVLPDYGPPIWQTIPNQTIFQGDNFTTFDLDDYLIFTGPCHGFDFDVYPFTGSAPDPAWPIIVPGANPMTMIARPLFADIQLAGAGAKLAGFVNGVLAGWAEPSGTSPNITYTLILKNVGAGNITFQFYDATHQYLYEELTTLAYAPGGSVGTIASPYLIQYSPLVPSLAANGVMTIAIDDPNWLGSYPVDFIVWDCNYPVQRRDTMQAVFSITNDVRPIISSAAAVNFEENACVVLYDTQTLDPNDSEGAGLTYSLAGGADVGRFSIDAVTGILTWAMGFSPDFESPADANTDNKYEVDIQVTNSANQTDVKSLTVTITNQAVEPFAVLINGGVNLLCQTGSVNLQATGGVSYVWSTGASSSAIVVNTSGTYTVTGTSTGACTATASVVVSPPASITAAGSNGAVCLGSSIQLSSTPAGGTPPYASFAWAGPNSYSANVEDPPGFLATPDAAGIYTVTVTDTPGCTATATKSIAVSANAAPTITASSNSPVCVGANITLNSTPSGGTGIYTQFSWAGPNNYIASAQNPPGFQATLLAGGTYTVTVTDNSGCSGTGTTSVSIIASPTITASVNSPICIGGTVLLTSTPSGGTQPYNQYSWAGPNSFSASVQNPDGFPALPLASGTYTVTVTDASGCTAKGTSSLSVSGLPSITATLLNPVCTGGTVALGSTPSGGSGQYASFLWSGPNAYSANVKNPLAFPVTPLVAGDYTVTVTDVAGCTATSSVTVVENTLPAVSAMNNGPVCEGSNISLSSTATGGTSPYTLFKWTGPDFYVASVEDPVPFVTTPASAGVYQVKVTDSKGCTATGTTTIAINTKPVITASSNSPLCIGANLSLQLSLSGGSGNYTTFSWTGPDNYSATVEDPPGFPATLANTGIYNVTVTDNAGCTATASTSVSVSTLNAPSISATSNSPLCGGSNLSLSSTPSGGSGIFTAFAWAGPNNYASTMEDPNPFPVFAPGGAGVYTVTVTDTKNCKATATVSVVVNGPAAAPTSNSPVCPNTNILLNAGGTGVSYAWAGPDNFSSNQANPPGFPGTPISAGVYTVSITDINGCTSNASVTVVVEDVTPPMITCPANQTMSANASCAGMVGAHVPLSATDNCAANPTVTQSPASSTVLSGHNDAKIITLTANDGNGNIAFCTFTVTLKDVTPPMIICPANKTVAADASCSGVVGVHAPMSVSDNCVASPTVTQSPLPTTVLSGYNDTKTVTLTAIDENSNSAFCTFTVTLKDITPPTISCPANKTVAADASCSGIVGSHSAVSVADNCAASPTVTQSPGPSTVLSGHNDVKTVTLTADDGNGNSAFCTFTVTLKDVTASTISCPANMTIAADANCSGLVGSYSAVSVGDNCNPNPIVTQSPAPSTVLSGHNDVKTVTLTADDGNGNSAFCTFTVILKDITPPTITCPANKTVAADASCNGVVGSHSAVSVADNCAASPTVTQSPGPSTVLSGHNDVKTVTLTADDGNGNSTFCTFTVTLKDVTPPPITCPANKTLAADANCSGIVGAHSPVAVSDNCATNPTVTQSPAPVTVLNGHNDVKTVTLTADDGNGNSAFCTFTVTLKDVTAPTISCPANMTIAADANCSGLVGSYSAVSVGDNCNPNPIVTQSPAPSTVLSGHNDVETVTLTADDGNGNTAFCTMTVTLKDVIKPSISCPANTTVAADANCSSPVGVYSAVSVSDNCTANPTVTQSPAPATLLGGHNDVKAITLTADDGNGNTEFCTFTVTLKDITPPTVVCKPFTTALNASGNVGITTANVYQSGADNCGVVNQVSVVPNAFTCSNLGANTVVLTVNDGKGNTATCNAVVTVVDLIPPTMLCKDTTLALNASGMATVSAAGINNGSSDNCTLSSLSLSPTNFSCANLGANTVTLTGTDQSGNTNTCQAIVTVIDTIRPTMICMNATLNLNAAGQATLTVANINNGSFDNCSITTFTLSKTNYTCADLGQNSVTLTGTDQSGNSSQCTATVTVQDLILPVAKCKNATVNLGANGIVIVTTAAVNNVSTDNCSFSLSVTPSLLTCANLGVNVVTLKATDSSGNTSTCTAQVTVKDVTPPTVLCKPVTIFLDNVGKVTLAPSQVDNGSTDNCSIVSRTLNNSQFNCSDLGVTVNVFLTATDQSGNTSICTAQVTVRDNIVPTAVCQNITVPLGPGGTVTVYGAQLAAASVDNCAVWSYAPVAKTYTAANLGPNNLAITVKDWSGNAATCTSVVTVVMNGPSERPGNIKINAFPNPTKGPLTLSFYLEVAEEVQVGVFDPMGKNILLEGFAGKEGENSILLELPAQEKAGIYFVVLKAGKASGKQKIMILRN